MWRVSVILLILVCLANAQQRLGANSRQNQRVSFNQSCSEETRCDKRASLVCTDNVCQCAKQEEMTWDSDQARCVVLAGERCSYTAVEMSGEEKRWTETLDCVTHSNCIDGYCSCSSEYFEDSRGLCMPGVEYGGNCTEDKECRHDHHLVCVDGSCSCNETEAVFSPTHQTCVGLVGASCSKYGSCVSHSICSYYHSTPQCVCDSRYLPSKNGLCLGKYHYSCSPLNPCSSEFSCIGGMCQCNHPQHQVYHFNHMKCISNVRGPCQENRDGTLLEYSCALHAECTNSSGVHECTCEKGYIESAETSCDIAHGEACDQNGSNEMCDRVAGLSCMNGKCECPNMHVYDKDRSTCLGLVGAVCDTRKVGACTIGAFCDRYRDPRSDYFLGVCRCEKSKISNSERKCIDRGTNGV